MIRGIICSYRRDRARTRSLMSWPVFMRAWCKSWVIAARTNSTSEARGEGWAWAKRKRIIP